MTAHDYILARGFEGVHGSQRYFRRGEVFIAIDKRAKYALILKRHPLRPEVFDHKHPFNVVYRGLNPFTSEAFADQLWHLLKLDKPVMEGKFESDEDTIEDANVILDLE